MNSKMLAGYYNIYRDGSTALIIHALVYLLCTVLSSASYTKALYLLN